MASDLYPILDVATWRVAAEEPAGADEKIWLADPGSGDRWLFKPVTVKNGHVHGEDWAEKAASELGALLELPCARTEMAVRRGKQGVLSLNLKPPGYEMHNGAVALSGLLPSYLPGNQNVQGRPGHSLENIATLLSNIDPPPESQLPAGSDGFDAFVGMIVLDAWIANRDRHDENWSILYPHDPMSRQRLCGAYDQAGCLGFNVTDARRREMLDNGKVAAWTAKGTAWRFEHAASPPTLAQLAALGLGRVSKTVRTYWLDLLYAATDELVQDVLERLPVLSDVARNFALEVLTINRERLLDECH